MEKLEAYAKTLIDDFVMDSLIIYKNGGGYIVNKKSDLAFDVRSIAKTVLSLACGILIEESDDFDLETYIYPIIKDVINLENKKNREKLEQIQVKHLLTHTTGYRDLVLKSKDIKDKDTDKLFDYIINYPIYYKPGDYFLYSNAGYYLLAISMQEFLGYDLFDYIEEKLFAPLEIKNRSWEKYGNYLAGATKLIFSADDMLKIGKLLINKGKYNGKQILSKSYVELMVKPLFTNLNETKRKYLSEDNYGLGIWISDQNTVFASGTGGQLIVLLYDLDIVMVTTNSGSDNKGYKIKQSVDEMINMIYKER